jgi:hypothetical protein
MNREKTFCNYYICVHVGLKSGMLHLDSVGEIQSTIRGEISLLPCPN